MWHSGPASRLSRNQPSEDGLREADRLLDNIQRSEKCSRSREMACWEWSDPTFQVIFSDREQVRLGGERDRHHLPELSTAFPDGSATKGRWQSVSFDINARLSALARERLVPLPQACSYRYSWNKRGWQPDPAISKVRRGRKRPRTSAGSAFMASGSQSRTRF